MAEKIEFSEHEVGTIRYAVAVALVAIDRKIKRAKKSKKYKPGEAANLALQYADLSELWDKVKEQTEPS